MNDDPLYRAKKSVGPALADHSDQPDMARMRGYRMGRFQAELKRLDYAGAVLFDPINIRYATGSRNMAVWTLHNTARYAFVPAEGKAVMFDFHGCADGRAAGHPRRSERFFAHEPVRDGHRSAHERASPVDVRLLTRATAWCAN